VGFIFKKYSLILDFTKDFGGVQRWTPKHINTSLFLFFNYVLTEIFFNEYEFEIQIVKIGYEN
jgi:hypothetical protein